ncbi:site-specific DNA-methyltransferase [Oligella sp. HMSC09E12]|uniref:site-specific DNA-methyltransferase n=1 Tax=Oligella sp. HMSC09E12 TaxID=1581147 RepID=UPI0008A16F6A|nr:site-specific DNA-methyltransferase [Oligella sp. HMSC09E12]OFV47870.1 hypothetical protein HMPREF3179_07400 [Oligella sp. HMSC09E12]
MTKKSLTPVPSASKDLVDFNIRQLKALFPNVFSEGKIDFDVLKNELGDNCNTGGSGERYQFTWAGKEQAKRIATTPSLGTLRPAPDESLNWESTENLYIEGDNLEVLKLLQKSYFNQIKMIYIDPPYNTGKDFVYKDNFRDNLANYQRLTGQRDGEGNPLTTNSESDGRYHSNWLNMMYPRLKLARNLLTDDGVIFISIDDNEQANLKKICDEVFGEENFVAQVVWERAYAPVNLKKHFSESHDYILAYAKNLSELVCFGLPRTEEANSRYDNPDNDPRGVWKSSDLSVGPAIEQNIYEITTPSGRVVLPPSGYSWRLSRERFAEFVNDNRIWFGTGGNSVPSIKRFLSEVRSGMTPMTIWKYQDVGHSQKASQDLKKLFDDNAVFTYPKPVDLLKRCMQLYTSSGDIILDFFAGSATSAHAVMQLNAEDGGNRKFIMIQLPEQTEVNSNAYQAGYQTICDIGKERIRRAATKIRNEYPETDIDLGFKVFKLDTSNLKKWQPDSGNLEKDLLDAIDNILPDRSNQDLLYEVLIKYGLPLTYPVEEIKIADHTIFNVANGSIIACFDEGIDLETVQAIAALSTEEQPVLRVVFRDTSFVDDIVKTNAIQRLLQAGIEDVLSI